jgi:putative transcriptional regulator
MRPLVGLLLVTLGAWVNAQERVRPDRGTLLVARSEIRGGPFFHSVVLLLAHGEDGTLGVILNRPTEIRLSEAIPDLDAGKESPALYFGGPVALDGLLVVFRSATKVTGAEEVMAGVYFSGDREVLARLLKEGRPGDELRLFIGHSGWAPRQLDAELREGSWDVLRADLSTVFRSEPEWMWERLQEDEGTIARASGRPPFFRAPRAAGAARHTMPEAAPALAGRAFTALRPPLTR